MIDKILDLGIEFPKFWESQIEDKCKHSVAMYGDVDIINIQRKIQETNEKLNTLLKKYDEEVERLTRQMGLLNRQITLRKNKTRNKNSFWLNLEES